MAVLYDSYWSDHLPIELECNINLIKPRIKSSHFKCNRVIWGERDISQIEKYYQHCHEHLRNINVPNEISICAGKYCSIVHHQTLINNLYTDIVMILSEAAEYSHSAQKSRKGKHVIGWNKHVREAHAAARLAFQTWIYHGKPNSGSSFSSMCETRRIFKNKLKWCQNNQQKIKMDIIAKHHSNKNFSKFWKTTNKLNPKPSLPVSVAGVHDPKDIANVFQRHFKVESRLGPSAPVVRPMQDTEILNVLFSAEDVDLAIKSMTRGKSPGHDSLSVEHLQHAGVYLPKLLSILFNLCICHSYLPDDLMRTVVVPIIKNKTGDNSDLSNYRPISLATIVAKVLDSLLNSHLDKHLDLYDAQFGFRSGLSTESAILCLKQTVQYYTARKTPVYACYLDLSKAFDLVSYNLLWDKLEKDTTVAPGIISLFKYWYGNQVNYVKWSGAHSDEYRLECGVRQGGLTSPSLFNLYMNRLIGELSSTNIGCHVDGTCMNNISYADDMVLLSPSVKALRQLLQTCESYAEAHGLRYNAKKTEVMMFQAKNKRYSTMPPVSLYGTPLKKVSQFKYLGHWVTEDLSDDIDVERERRALSVRCNMLARRFALCSESVKVTLFKAYCQSFYASSLWVKYTQRAYNALRVQFNNAFRALMGLPRYCSASGMFAEAQVDGFHAIMRKRCASLLSRLRGSPNSLLSVWAEKWESPMLWHWIKLHTQQK